MHSLAARSLFLALAVFGTTSIACGGSKKPAEAPQSDVAEAPRSGSTTPDPTAGTTSGDKKDGAPSTAAAAPSASADNGSDIVPPFPSAGATATKETDKDPSPTKKAGKTKKSGGKSGGKSKKKG